jgi:hypothetical protein
VAGKPNYSAAGILNLIFLGTAFGGSGGAGTNIAINAATNSVGNWYVSLHTNDPTTTGGQNTNEVAYTGYARVAVARTTAGWTVTNANATCTPNANIQFGAMSGGAGGTVNFFGIGDSALGSNGNLIYVGNLSPTITIANGVTPIILNNSTITEA